MTAETAESFPELPRRPSVGDASPQSAPEGVKSASRVLAVIRLLTAQPAGATFVEISHQLAMPKSSTHALLRTMVDEGFLVMNARSRHYRVGVRLWEAGQAYLAGMDLPTIARPFMEQVRDELRETVQLAILDGIENVYVEKVDADQRLVLRSRVGARLPAYATGLGKVLLAGLADTEVQRRFAGVRFERFTPRTITDLPALLHRLKIIRENGYGTDDGEYTSGVVCVAAPIRDHTGDVVAAMSVSVPDVRASAQSSQHTIRVMQERARALSAELGDREEIA